jgi:hypothetical protein
MGPMEDRVEAEGRGGAGGLAEDVQKFAGGEVVCKGHGEGREWRGRRGGFGLEWGGPVSRPSVGDGSSRLGLIWAAQSFRPQ